MRGGACSTHRFLRRLGRVISRVMVDMLSSGAGHHVAVRSTMTTGARRGTGGRPGGHRQGMDAPPGRGGGGSRTKRSGRTGARMSPSLITAPISSPGGAPSSLMKRPYPIYNGKVVVGKGATCKYSR